MARFFRLLCLGCAAGLSSAAPDMAQAETVALSAADCKKLVQHVPADDVTYKPGVDVRGKAVVPADLGGGYDLKIPEEIHIQIGIDLADRLALRDARRSSGSVPTARKVLPFEGKAAIGVLTVKGNDAFWNGERIASQDEALLAEACRKGLSESGLETGAETGAEMGADTDAVQPGEEPEPPKP